MSVESKKDERNDTKVILPKTERMEKGIAMSARSKKCIFFLIISLTKLNELR